MARRPGQGVQTRGGWKTTLQHMMKKEGPADGGIAAVPSHVPLKVGLVVVWGGGGDASCSLRGKCFWN